jgi:hypothetical protein
MSNGNGNGEVKRLVELKHTFKAEASQLEEDLRKKFAQELEAAEKNLKDKYLEQVVDWFYSNGFGEKPPEPEQAPAAVAEPAPQPETESTASSGPTCPNCGANLVPGDKFCSQCASPIEDQETEQALAATPVATAGRLSRRGYVGYAQPPARAREATERRLTAEERLQRWGRTQRR